MRALDQKLLRDIWQLRTQSLAIALVIACGVGMIVMSLSTQRSLEGTRAEFYDEYRFAEVFVSLKRAPQSVAARIASIPGVREVQTRVVVNAFLDIEGMEQPAVGQLYGIPVGHQPVLNRVHLRMGRYLDPAGKNETLISETFAEAHDLLPGDSLYAVINGRRQRLTVVGIALSPETIYEIQPGQIVPEPRTYGVLWMSEEELAAAYDMEGAFNSVTVTLEEGASQAEVIDRLDDLTQRYGGAGAYGRRDQISHRFLDHEMEQLKSMGTVVPLIFLGVAAFLLNIVMSRLISTQREQIAVLKAFGYRLYEIGGHYLLMTLLVSAGGALMGTVVGIVLGRQLTHLYTGFFHFPVFQFQLAMDVVYWGWGIAAFSAGVGAANALWKAMRLPPAEAMRPEPPARYRRSLMEVAGLAKFMSPAWRMIFRQIERTPGRSALSVLGVSMGVSVMILGSFMEDSVAYIINLMFFETQRYDVSVTFTEPTTSSVKYELEQLPGVVRSERFRAVPARLRLGHRSRLVSIQGLPTSNDLYRFVDIQGEVVELPPTGVMLSAELARLLGASAGDELTVEVLEGKRPRKQIRVAATVDDVSGLSAYMEFRSLGKLIGEEGTSSGAYLQVDRRHQPQLLRELKQTPRVAAVNVKQAAIDSFRETIAKNLLTMRLFNVIFAGVIAVGVVYNTARVALAERSRDLATLRVLGFTRGEISAILLGELAVITLAGLPVGCGLGYLFAMGAISSIDRELFRIPLVVQSGTYLMAISVVVMAAVLASLLVRRRLDRLDLVEVLKTRE